ncbi:Uncharacterised protein [Mycobacteroides abscessus subsp. abscessus]|nr:Uncharacterised protein [Mycobacteroides abscessus subsp. abscessus]
MNSSGVSNGSPDSIASVYERRKMASTTARSSRAWVALYRRNSGVFMA